MRSSITILMLMLAVTFVSAASIDVKPADDAIYNVYYKGTEAGAVKVTILNNNKQIVFSEVIRSSGFKRPYNFRELPEGDYTVVISSKEGEQTQKISHRLKSVEASKSLIRVTSLEGNEGKYLLVIANAASQDVWVRIYHNSTGLIHEEKIAVNGSTAQVYNLSQVIGREKSSIQFEVTTQKGQVATTIF